MVTPFLSAPLTCSLISGARLSAVSIAKFIRLRVLRSKVGSPQAQPHAQAVVARWNDIMNSSARHRRIDIFGTQHLPPDRHASLEQGVVLSHVSHSSAGATGRSRRATL